MSQLDRIARRRTPGTAVTVVGGLVAVGLAVLVIKWLLITAALLVVPFGVWWVVDRSRSRDAVSAGAMTSVLHTGRVPVPEMVPTSTPAYPVVPAPRQARHARPVAAPTLTGLPVAVSGSATPRSGVPARPFLAPDRRVTITGDEDHQATIARHHRDRPVTRVTAELHASVVPTGRHSGSYVLEVRLDGERVGELTAAASTRYRRLIDATPGGSAACLATIAHGERGYQIELRLPKSS